MPKSGHRKRSVPDYESYYVLIEACDPSYSFAVNASKHVEGPYWEHLSVTFNGYLLAPQRLRGKRLPLVFLGRRDDKRLLENVDGSDWRPKNIGVLTLRGQRTEFLGSLPNDALWSLLHAHLGGTFKIIHLHGSRERGRVEIRSVHFSRDVHPDDLL